MATIADTLKTLILQDLFREPKDKTPQYTMEALAMEEAVKNASTEEEFSALSNILPEYYKRNDFHGPTVQVKEHRIKALHNTKKLEYERFKQAHLDTIKMTKPNYFVSPTDKDGGIQNIKVEDIYPWNHAQLTEELKKVNRLRDSFKLKGYKYHMKDSPHNTDSLKGNVENYYKSIMTGLEVAIETETMPRDDVLLRAVISGNTEKVKQHMDEQQKISGRLYTSHSSNVDSYDSLLNKISAYKEPNQIFDLNKFLNSVVKGEEGGSSAELMNNIFNMAAEQGKFILDYDDYANKISIALENELDLKNQANKRHKQYTGKLYEEVDDISVGLQKFYEEGFSQEVIVEDDIVAPVTEGEEEDYIVQETTTPVLKKDKDIVKTDLDTKRYSNQPETFPRLKMKQGKFVFEKDDKLNEWDNIAFIKGFEDGVPVLNAGYDKYFWHKGKWRHMSQAPSQVPATPEKAFKQTRGERQIALGKAKEDIIGVMRNLGYTSPGDAAKKVVGEPIPVKQEIFGEKKYGIKKDSKYIQKLWDKYNSRFPNLTQDKFASSIIQQWGELSKKDKAQYGSFKVFTEAIMEMADSGRNISME